MKPAVKTDIALRSITGGDMPVAEKMHWLPIDRLCEYDIRPKIAIRLAAEPPAGVKVIVNDERIKFRIK